MPQRNTAISICKAFAIILVCLGHTEGPGLLMTAIYLFHMPVFFITAGYFFSKKYLSDPWTFCVKRVKGLYVPFVKWSVFFLIIHNVLFKIGILSEQFGNWEGGVTHPYTLHQALQRLTSIIFSMGGYDEFLAGAFWFFRALLLTSIVFLVLYIVLKNVGKRMNDDVIVIIIGVAALAFAALKIHFKLSIPTVVQGGIRECWGIFFFAVGVMYRKYEPRFRKHWYVALICLAIIALGAYLHWAGMNLKPKLQDVLTLPLTGCAGFIMTYYLAIAIDKRDNPLKRFLVYCGDNTLYIFVWHVTCFKIVSAIKIAYYRLEWGKIGTHMVVHEHSTDDLFFILYTIVGTLVPLAGIWCYRKATKPQSNLS